MPESATTGAWFIARSGESMGPYTWLQLRSAAQDGELTARDWVWCRGMGQWVRAEEQAGLHELVLPARPSAMPPPPPPPSNDLEITAVAESQIERTSDEATVFARPPGSKRGSTELGDTTRQFLAAAGVSARVRRRRRRRALVALVLGGVAVGAGYQEVVAPMMERRDAPPAPASEAPTALAVEETSALDAAQRCRLTGTCKTPRSPSLATGTIDEPASPTETRRGDIEPQAVPLARLTTDGVKSAALKGGPAAIPKVRGEDVQGGLTDMETILVKRKVTPGLKSCRSGDAGVDVVVRMTTDADGNVSKVSVPKGPSTVRRCLRRRAKYWRFGRHLATRQLELKMVAKQGLVRITGGPKR